MPEAEPPVGLGDIDTAPLNLSAPRGSATPEDYEKLWAQFTQVSEEKVQLLSEVEALRKAGATNEILDGLIKPYALRTFVFMCGYCAFVGAMLVAGIAGHALPVPVLQILVGSTAVTVIGLVGMVLTGIFVGARRRAE